MFAHVLADSSDSIPGPAALIRISIYVGGDLWTSLAVTKNGPSYAVGVSSKVASYNSAELDYEVSRGGP